MNWSKLRTVLAALVLVVVGAVAFAKITESYWVDTSLEGQTRRLQSGWAFQRREAAASLAQFGGDAERVAPVLSRALADPDRQVRANALQSLKAVGSVPAESAPALLDILQHDQDSTTRQEAASLLSTIKVPSASAALVEAIDDRDPDVRQSAMNALTFHGASAGSGPGVDKLIAVVASDQPENIRLAAIQALGSIGRDQERVARFMPEVLKTDPSPVVRNNAALLTMNSKYGFEIPALIAALDDQSPQVRLTAGGGLAAIGLGDDRIVPALCRAARKADDLTREGIGVNIGKLRWDPPTDNLSVETATRRFQTAVKELKSLLDRKDSAARRDVVTVFARLVLTYQRSAHPPLLDPAREALASVLARIVDENEDLPIRLHAMNQWTLIRPSAFPPARGRPPVGESPPAREQVHAPAAWLAVLSKTLTSPAVQIRSRAVEILADSVKDSHPEEWYRDAWRKIVRDLAKSTASEDVKVRNGSMAILELLGPEAREALGTLEALALNSQDPGARAPIERAIESISSVDRLKSQDPKVRLSACETVGRLGWRASSAVPALTALTKDSETEVRLAAVSALRSLGNASSTAVTQLATNFAGESNATVKVALLGALDAIAPGVPPVVNAHLSALQDTDPAVRKAAVTFPKVPLDDAVVSALGKALGDPSDDVRRAAAGSLTAILFESPAIVPILVNGLRDDRQRKAVVEALDKDYEQDPDSRGLGHFRTGIPGIQAAVNVAIPVLRDALAVKNNEISSRVLYLLGRIVSFSAITRNDELRKAVEPALPLYLQGLEGTDPAVCQEALSRLDSIPIDRAVVVRALLKYLDRSDQSTEDRISAFAALAAQATFIDSDANLRGTLVAAVPILMRALGAAEPQIRESAILVLGYIGTAAIPAEDTLNRLAKNDPQPNVRKNAENAIKAVKGIAKMRPTSRRGTGAGMAVTAQ
jgi:HEAT repeat protein